MQTAFLHGVFKVFHLYSFIALISPNIWFCIQRGVKSYSGLLTIKRQKASCYHEDLAQPILHKNFIKGVRRSNTPIKTSKT